MAQALSSKMGLERLLVRVGGGGAERDCGTKPRRIEVLTLRTLVQGVAGIPQLQWHPRSLSISWKCNALAACFVGRLPDDCPGRFICRLSHSGIVRKHGNRGPRRVLYCHEESESRPESGSEEQKQNVQPYGIPATSVPDRWDVIGLGQAMVDFSAIVGDGFLQGLGLVKGTRKIVNHEERGRVLRALDGCSYKVTAGGSLSNTLVALARLGMGYGGDPQLNVAMTGSVGSDPLGDFYRTKLLRANVHFLSQPISDSTTGTVIVCTTPDAQRTMLSYQGMSSILNFEGGLEKRIFMSRVLVVEGYLWELPETIETITKACRTAHKQGILVALTASDLSCVKHHREKMWDVMAGSADILFANSDEARALLGCDSSASPATVAKLLSRYCPLVSVTDGACGSYIGLKGEVSYIQPAACVPVDTCGAGDAYAAGVLYGLLRGVPDLKGIGNLAARVASVVVGQQGTRLKEDSARELATSVPTLSCLLEGLNLSINTETGQSVNV